MRSISNLRPEGPFWSCAFSPHPAGRCYTIYRGESILASNTYTIYRELEDSLLCRAFKKCRTSGKWLFSLRFWVRRVVVQFLPKFTPTFQLLRKKKKKKSSSKVRWCQIWKGTEHQRGK